MKHLCIYSMNIVCSYLLIALAKNEQIIWGNWVNVMGCSREKG